MSENVLFEDFFKELVNNYLTIMDKIKNNEIDLSQEEQELLSIKFTLSFSGGKWSKLEQDSSFIMMDNNEEYLIADLEEDIKNFLLDFNKNIYINNIDINKYININIKEIQSEIKCLEIILELSINLIREIKQGVDMNGLILLCSLMGVGGGLYALNKILNYKIEIKKIEAIEAEARMNNLEELQEIINKVLQHKEINEKLTIKLKENTNLETYNLDKIVSQNEKVEIKDIDLFLEEDNSPKM